MEYNKKEQEVNAGNPTPKKRRGSATVVRGVVISEKKMSLIEKIFMVQQEVGIAQKSGENIHNHYKYAKELDIISTVKPILGKYRLAITHTTVSREVVEKTKTYGINFTIHNIDGNETKDTLIYGEGEEKAGSTVATPIAYTMALKYFLAKTFLIETGDDAEIEKRKAGKGETQDQKFEKAKKMIENTKQAGIAGLIEYAETKLPKSAFTKEQKAELTALINSKADQTK